MNALNSFYRLFPNRPVAAAPVARRTPAPAPAPAAVAGEASRPVRYRSRDYGTGYGRSSGYAQDRYYARPSGHRLVRVG